MKPNNFSFRLWPISAFICRCALALIFFYAAWEKIIFPREFAKAVYFYQLLPDFAVNLTAVVLPVLEFLLGACLLAGLCVRGASLISALLFLIFATALSINLARGLDISCGCFGSSSGNINWLYLVRDVALLGISLWVLLFDRGWKFLSGKTESLIS